MSDGGSVLGASVSGVVVGAGTATMLPSTGVNIVQTSLILMIATTVAMIILNLVLVKLASNRR
jgi:hypothetical protein